MKTTEKYTLSANSRKLTSEANSQNMSEELSALAQGVHHNPFKLLGRHKQASPTDQRSTKNIDCITILAPGACRVCLETKSRPMQRFHDTDIFFYIVKKGEKIPPHYRVIVEHLNHGSSRYIDPYSFDPQLTDFDLHLIAEGTHHKIYDILGATPKEVDGIEGILFATWAPNAERVSIVGDFNGWNGLNHPMRNRGSFGIWELFIPGIEIQCRYKYEIRCRNTGLIQQKSDAYGRCFELRPKTATLVHGNANYSWQDEHWLKQRSQSNWNRKPVSIYELHLGSWKRDESGGFLNYRELAKRLVPYVQSLGFTHVELLPIAEHPYDASWGYQTTGFFAPTSRFGTPEDFCYFIDYCHQHGIGVLLDWVASHFPKDDHGLRQYDGTALYEHADPRKGEHQDWGTLIFNYGRNEVKNFLVGNALFWLDQFHLDGLRVDAVASMLYLDYSREDGDWQANIHGGNENLEAIEFLKELNEVTHQEFPGVMIIAEESTAWPQVSRPTYLGGLGFSMKWSMGWMHDTLDYMANDPIHRRYHHNKLTFGMLYSFTENFVLALSHDEVVHGKSSLLHKMPGDDWQKFANLRLLYTYMFSYPGKKLLFMGGEFGQRGEWQHDNELDWSLLNFECHCGISHLISDLNAAYTHCAALHTYDFEADGFAWIDCNDSDQSVLSYCREANDSYALVLLNFTPIPRQQYRIGVQKPGLYRELINSDSTFYGGSDIGNEGTVESQAIPWMGYANSILLTLPPLAGLILEHQNTLDITPTAHQVSK